MAQTIKDFILEFGFDGKAVSDGLKGIEAQLAGFGRQAERSQQSKMKASKTFFADQLRNEERLAKSAERLAVKRSRTLTALKVAERKAISKLGGSGSDEIERSLDRTLAKINKFRAQARSATSAGDFSKVANGLRLTNQQLDLTIQKSNKITRAFQAQKFAANAAKDSARNLARSYLSVFAAVGAAGAIGRTGMEFEAIRASMLAASGSAAQAEKDFKFVQETALNLGRDVKSSAKGFQQLAVAANDAGMSAAEAKEMFLAGSEASTAFGLSTEDTFGVFRAFTQIISKGTVSSEELKQQLGDRLPIALSTASKAMGVTIQQLIKMLENGELVSTDFLPKFSKELRKAARNGGALTASLKTTRVALSRLKTTFDISVDKAFREGMGEGFSSFLENLRMITENSAPAFKTLGRVVGSALKGIGFVLRALMQVLRPFSVVLDQITMAFSTASENLESADEKATALSRTLSPLVRVLKLLAAAALLPFALIELAMIRIEKMEDGFLKTLSALGIALAGMLTVKKGASAFKKSGTSAGSMFGKAFQKAFLLSLAFGLGEAIGGIINEAISNSEDGGVGVSNAIGTSVDRLRTTFLGDTEAEKRLTDRGEDPSLFGNFKSFFSRTAESFLNESVLTPKPGSMMAKRLEREAAARGDINIVVNANGLDTEGARIVAEGVVQTTLKSSVVE